MARFKDRYNLFTGKLRVAPRPFVPAHWDVPKDYPSATRFWVEPNSGATASCPDGEGWTFSEALRQWHLRQSGRVWAGRRLVARYGREEATRRIKDLQRELSCNIRTANAYLDLLVSIDYEAFRLTQRAARAEQMLLQTTREVIQVAAYFGKTVGDLELAGNKAVSRAQEASRALDDLADMLKKTISPLDRRFDPQVGELIRPRGEHKDVCEWVSYTMPTRKYRKPDLNWLLASAVVTFLENKPEVSTEVACRRVSGYLEMLDAPFGSGRDDSPELLEVGAS